MEDNFNKYSKLNSLHFSRETFLDFELFINLLLEKNKDKNLISKKTEENIRERHIIDSAQAIDFIDLNDKIFTDLGSGGGMPGIVLAIIFKNLGKTVEFNLYEKSYHKSNFLKDVSRELSLNANIIQKNVFESKKIKSDTIIARAFKPLPEVLELIDGNFTKYKNLIFFMGKKGKQTLNEVFNQWEFEYKEKNSLTNKDSFLINIQNIKKKFD
jgi:16S rRNA (guanine527-N7)-methyltransferase